MENPQSNLPEAIFDNLIKIANNIIDPIDDNSDTYINENNDSYPTDLPVSIDKSTIDIVTTMLNLISKELDLLKQNPTDRINEISIEHNNICDDFNDTIKKNPILTVVANNIKSDINICKRLHQDNLIKEYQLRQIHKSIYIRKQDFNKYMLKKNKKSSYTAEDMWATDVKAKKIGIKLQYVLNILKYIIQSEQKNNQEDLESDISDSDIIDASDIFNDVCNQHQKIMLNHKKIIADDMCLVILACEIESHINNYIKENN